MSSNNKPSKSSKDNKDNKKTSTTHSTTSSTSTTKKTSSSSTEVKKTSSSSGGNHSSSHHQSSSHSSSSFSRTPTIQQHDPRYPENFTNPFSLMQGQTQSQSHQNQQIQNPARIQLSNSQLAAMQWSNSQFSHANQAQQISQVTQGQKKDSGVRLTPMTEEQRQDPRYQGLHAITDRAMGYTPGPMIYPTDGTAPFQAGGSADANSISTRAAVARANAKGWRVVWSQVQSGQGQGSQISSQLLAQGQLQGQGLLVGQGHLLAQRQLLAQGHLQGQGLLVGQGQLAHASMVLVGQPQVLRVQGVQQVQLSSSHSSRDQKQMMAQIQAQLQGFGLQLQAPVMPNQGQQMGENKLVKSTVTEREVTVTKKGHSSSSKKDEKNKGKDGKKGGKK